MRLSNRKMQWWMGLSLTVLAVAAVLFGPGLWADMVVTDAGTEWNGDVLSDDDNMIIIQTDRGIMYIPRQKVRATFYAKFPNSSAKVEEVTGAAEYERKSRPDDWREVIIGMKLRPGDTIRTGEDSKVILTVAGQSVTALEANSSLTVSEMKRNKDGDVRVRLAMDVGQLWNDVGTLNSAKSRYTVETPQASAGVRGTVYTIMTDAESDETTVATVEGAVQVVQKQEDGESFNVGAGEQTSLAITGAAETETIQAGFLSEWDTYKSNFEGIRSRMELENFFARFDDLFKRVGLTGRQGVMASAGGLGLIVIGLGVVLIRGWKN